MVMQRTVRLPKCSVQIFNYFTLDATVPPRRSPAGVRSFGFPRFGRLPFPCVASNSISSSTLDAMPITLWRPFFQLSQFWTPVTSRCGVRSFGFPRFGRLPFPYVASNSISSSILDAMPITLWRPFFQPSQFWTPSVNVNIILYKKWKIILYNFSSFQAGFPGMHAYPSACMTALLWK